MVDTNYLRVIPRDLFNEAKLLKCLGRLCLLIHDGLTPVRMSFEEPDGPFCIGLTDDGCLMVVNVTIQIMETQLCFKTIYNSKEAYPLFVEHESCDYLVFDEQGNFTNDFIDFCNTIK